MVSDFLVKAERGLKELYSIEEEMDDLKEALPLVLRGEQFLELDVRIEEGIEAMEALVVQLKKVGK